MATDSAGGSPVGVFGLLAAGNIGNDASFEVVLADLRARRPDARVDVMCPAPDRLTSRYAVPATRLWSRPGRPWGGRAGYLALLAATKLADAARILAWTRRQDVVLVPGMGVLETGLPLRPWESPYAFFVLGLSARLLRRPLMLVAVGADDARRPVTRALLDGFARAARYRSYRDKESREVMRRRGIDVGDDHVFADLAFRGAPVAARDRDPALVCVGVMGYRGGEDDRSTADAVHDEYVRRLAGFVGGLVDDGFTVRLVLGDTADAAVADRMRALTLDGRPAGMARSVEYRPVTTFAELTDAMSDAVAVVATRYHNLVCALRLAVPAVSLGYGPKNAALMETVGLADFCQALPGFDPGLLRAQLDRLLDGRELVEAQLRRHAEELDDLVGRQLDELSMHLDHLGVPPSGGTDVEEPHRTARRGTALRGGRRTTTGRPT